MSNIIDTIRVSGTDYTLSATSSGVSVVEVTQAQYDALPSSAKTDTSKMYVITDAEAGDLTNYYTKTETNSAITQATSGKADTSYVDQSVSGKVDTTTFNTYSGSVETALSGKQDTLVSGTNIKTINNESILGSGNIDIQGGGKAIEAGRGISVTTGETADTVSFNLPISAGTGSNSLVLNAAPSSIRNAVGKYSFVGGGGSSNAEGESSFIFGNACRTKGANSISLGQFLYSNNFVETSLGRYNNSVMGSSTFGNSGNTLFSVGNGTSNSARHNAFEIRQNGDIYLSSGGTDIKLQDTISATAANTTALGGLKLVKLTQSEYDALLVKDNDTLYIING